MSLTDLSHNLLNQMTHSSSGHFSEALQMKVSLDFAVDMRLLSSWPQIAPLFCNM